MKKFYLLLSSLMVVCGAFSQQNIAPQATATHSGGGATSLGFGPENYNDGIIPAFNCAPTPCGWGWVSTNGWIEFTWATPQTFNGVKFYKDNRPMASCTFQYWDGLTYVNFLTFNSPNSPVDSVTFPHVTSTKIRFSTIAPASSFINPNFREIEVYSAPSAPNDVGVSSILLSTDFCGDQVKDVNIKVINYGTSIVNSLNVDWSINNIPQAPINFFGVLDTFGGIGPVDTVLFLGSVFFNASSLYELKAWTSSPNGSSDTVNVNDTAYLSFTTKPAPQPAPTVFTPSQSVCSGSSALLSASGTGTVTWYSDPQLTQVVGVGGSVLSGPVTSGATFYAANDIGTTGQLGLPNRVGSTTNNGYSGVGLMFSAFQPFKLTSVAVYPVAGTPSGNVTATIELRNSSNAVIESITVSLPTAVNPGLKTVVPLNFNVPAGTDHRLVFSSASGGGLTGFIREITTGFTYPYTLPGVASITSAFTGGAANSSYYYYFYDWQVQTGTGCPGVDSMTVNISPVPPTPNFSYTVTDNVVQFTNLTNSGATYSWDFGDLTASTAVSPTKAYSNTGTYFVTLTASNSCVSNMASAPQAINITTMAANDGLALREKTRIFPNPAEDLVFIDIPDNENNTISISIFSFDGKLIKRTEMPGGSQVPMAIGELPSGLYLIKIELDGKNFIHKLVKN